MATGPKLIKPRWETPKPNGVKGSYGPLVIDWAYRKLGITFGAWQSYAITNALRYDKNGDLIHRTVLLSTGRQNGKSVIVRSFYGWLLDEGRHLPPFANWTTLLAAAHDAKQARIIYKGVYLDLGSIPSVKATTRLTQYFGIEADNGLQLDTVTSQAGSARGLSAGAIAWDEMLTQTDWSMWEALSPAQSAQRSPIMLMTSTAGHKESVVLRSFYDKLKRIAKAESEPDPSFYGAWWESSDPDAGLDWDQLKQANPALGDGRLTQAAIKSEYSILPPDSWKRERLNHFLDVTAPGAFNWAVWDACRLPDALDGLTGPYALAVDVHPGWSRATICVAAKRPDGRIGVEVYKDLRAEPTNPLTPDRIIKAIEAFPGQVQTIAYDSVGAMAGDLSRHEALTGLPYDVLGPSQMVSACMDFDSMVRSGTLAADDPLLDAQIQLAAKRPIGQDGGFRFSRKHSLGEIDAVLSATLAAHAIAFQAAMPSIV